MCRKTIKNSFKEIKRNFRVKNLKTELAKTIRYGQALLTTSTITDVDTRENLLRENARRTSRLLELLKELGEDANFAVKEATNTDKLYKWTNKTRLYKKPGFYFPNATNSSYKVPNEAIEYNLEHK